MKRFIGLLLTGFGGVVTLYGAYFLITGSTKAMLDPLPVTALTGGLIGVSCLTVGLVWVRD